MQDDSLIQKIQYLLSFSGFTLGTAESCTGGLIAAKITDTPGSSSFFWGGIVAYSNESKINLLGVKDELIHTHGAVSEVVAKAMASGLAEKTGVHFSLSVTGIAGPSGGSPERPVGTVWIGLCQRPKLGSCGSELCQAFLLHCRGNRQQIRQQTVEQSLVILLHAIEESIR